MKKIIKKNYLFIIFFLLFILQEPIYKLFYIKKKIYNTTRCNILESDYNKLLEFSEINVIYESDYINTVIIYKDIYEYLNEITIRGGVDDFLKNYPVIYDNTLVGLVDSVGSNTSKVKLITNKDIKISVKINDNVGVLLYNNGELYVRNINNLAQISVGDDIYTSGIGNTKENIYIGTVKEIILDDKSIEKIIKVDYKLNIKDIDYVTVIKENLL